jgi:hypothetical protein
VASGHVDKAVPLCVTQRPLAPLLRCRPAEVPALVDRLVLVNPATSFSSSLWPVLGPLLPRVPPELYRALPLALAPILANPVNLLAAGLDARWGCRAPTGAVRCCSRGGAAAGVALPFRPHVQLSHPRCTCWLPPRRLMQPRR